MKPKPKVKKPAKKGVNKTVRVKKAVPVRVKERKKAPNEARSEGGLFGEGNQFWQIRSKHGRDRLFKTPQEMATAMCEYFQWCIDNPLIEVVPFHSQGVVTMAKVPKLRVYTIQGLCHYLDCNVQYFNDFEKSLDGKTDKDSADFSSVIARAREIIYNQKYTGASSGFFNPSIIMRDLGLREQTDLNIETGKQKIADNFDKLFTEDDTV